MGGRRKVLFQLVWNRPRFLTTGQQLSFLVLQSTTVAYELHLSLLDLFLIYVLANILHLDLVLYISMPVYAQSDIHGAFRLQVCCF